MIRKNPYPVFKCLRVSVEYSSSREALLSNIPVNMRRIVAELDTCSRSIPLGSIQPMAGVVTINILTLAANTLHIQLTWNGAHPECRSWLSLACGASEPVEISPSSSLLLVASFGITQ